MIALDLQSREVASGHTQIGLVWRSALPESTNLRRGVRAAIEATM